MSGARLSLHTAGAVAQWGRRGTSGDVLEASPQRQMLLAPRGWRRGASQHPGRPRAAPTARVTQCQQCQAEKPGLCSLFLRRGFPPREGLARTFPLSTAHPGGAPPPPRVRLGWAPQDTGVCGASLDLRRVSEGKMGCPAWVGQGVVFPSPPSHGGPPPYLLAGGPPLSPPSERVPGVGLRWALVPHGRSGHLCPGISGEGVEAAPAGQQFAK